MEFWYLVSTYVDNTVEIGGFLSNWFHWLDDKKTRFLYKVTPSILHVYDSYDQLNHLLHAITLTTEDVYIFHMVCFLSYPCLFQSSSIPHFIWIWAIIVMFSTHVGNWRQYRSKVCGFSPLCFPTVW